MIYQPTYKRFKPSLHLAYEKKKFYGRKRSEVPFFEWATQKAVSSICCAVDKVAEEHFDVVIYGCDCLLSLCQAYILQEKGFRVLIYPSPVEDKKINTLVRSYSELESEKLIDYVYKKVIKKSPPLKADLVNTIKSLSGKLSLRSKSNLNFGQCLIAGGQKYFIDTDWTSFHDDRPMFSLKDGESINMDGVWNIPLTSCQRFIQNNHIAENGYLGVSDMCITTFDHIIINTRPDFNMNIDDTKHRIIYFSDAKNKIESRNKCSVVDRIKDVSQVCRYFYKDFSGVQNAR